MDGRGLVGEVLSCLDRRAADALLFGEKVIYDCLDEAACTFARISGSIYNSVTITTTADQQSYPLPPDFIRPLTKDRGQNYVGKYVTPAGDVSWPRATSYEKVFRSDLTAAAEQPKRFCIVQNPTAAEQISGTITAAGASGGGRAELHDDTADFSAVMVRDAVYNLTRRTTGIVLTAGAILTCAMFPSGRGGFVIGDSYVIRPESREQLLFDSRSSISGATLTLPYVSLPRPVYSDYDFLGLAPETCRAIAAEAAFLLATRVESLKPDPILHQRFLAELQQHKVDRAMSYLHGEIY